MSWPLVKLGEVAEVNPRCPKDIDEDQMISFVTMASASEEGLLLNEEPRVLKETKKGFTYFEHSDVLLAKITPCFENGKSLRPYQINNKVGFGSTEFHVLRANLEKLDPAYLFYMVWNEAFRFYGTNAMSGAAGQKRVGTPFLKQLEIPLPPLAEQKRIAAILDKANAIRQKRKQAIELADEFLRSVFLDMFGDPVVNPKGWEVEEIDQVCTEIVDCVNRTAPSVDYETPYKMIRTTNIRNHKIDLSSVRYVEKDVYEKWIRRLKPEVGDVIFTREAPAGEAGIINFKDNVFLGQRTMHFRPDSEKITSTFLLYELMASGVQQQITRLSTGSTVTHLSVPECKKFKIRMPDIDNQQRFTDIANKVERSKNFLLISLEQSIESFNSLSQKAFSNQL